jgi:hypothetical protein
MRCVSLSAVRREARTRDEAGDRAHLNALVAADQDRDDALEALAIGLVEAREEMAPREFRDLLLTVKAVQASRPRGSRERSASATDECATWSGELEGRAAVSDDGAFPELRAQRADSIANGARLRRAHSRSIAAR